MRNASIDLSINHRGFGFFRSIVYSEVSKLYSWIRVSGYDKTVIGVANRGRRHNGRRNRFFTFRVLGSSAYRVLGVTGVVTRFVGLFVTGIAGASNDAIEVVMGVLSRGRGPAETPRSTGGPSLGNWSWRGIRVLYVLVCDI